MPEIEELVQQTLEDLTKRLRALERKRGVRTKDYRIPNLATNFDVEDAIFSPACRMYQTGTQSINDETITVLTMDATLYDTFNGVDLSNDQIIIRRSGLYFILSQFSVAVGTDSAESYAGIRITGFNSRDMYDGGWAQSLASAWIRHRGIFIEALVVGDTVKSLGYHNSISGSARSTLVSPTVISEEASGLTVVLLTTLP